MSNTMTTNYQQDPKDKSEAEKAYERAIFQGRLSGNPNDKNYAGFYMYMGRNGKDLFKNIETRQYDV